MNSGRLVNDVPQQDVVVVVMILTIESKIKVKLGIGVPKTEDTPDELAARRGA